MISLNTQFGPQHDFLFYHHHPQALTASSNFQISIQSLSNQATSEMEKLGPSRPDNTNPPGDTIDGYAPPTTPSVGQSSSAMVPGGGQGRQQSGDSAIKEKASRGKKAGGGSNNPRLAKMEVASPTERVTRYLTRQSARRAAQSSVAVKDSMSDPPSAPSSPPILEEAPIARDPLGVSPPATHRIPQKLAFEPPPPSPTPASKPPVPETEPPQSQSPPPQPIHPVGIAPEMQSEEETTADLELLLLLSRNWTEENWWQRRG